MAEPTNEPTEGDAPEPPPSRLQRLFGDRPLSVFGVLLAGGAVLLVLLIVVAVTSLNDEGPNRATCLGIEFAAAEQAIRTSQVRQMNVVTRQDDPERGPLAVTVDFADQSCRRLPEGVAAQAELYRLIGMATVYNQTYAGEQAIALRWETQANIPAELLATATITPTPMPTATATATTPATATPAATATIAPTRTPAPTATATPPPTATAAPTTAATATGTSAPPTATSVPPTRTPAPPTATARPTQPPTVTPSAAIATPRATARPATPAASPKAARIPTRTGTPAP